MANIKSQIKRNRQNQKKRELNRIYRGSARTSIKKARESIDSGKPDEAVSAVANALSVLDRAAQKGVIHKNNAARRKSRLLKKLSRKES